MSRFLSAWLAGFCICSARSAEPSMPGPSDAVSAAARDIRRLPSESRTFMRYLVLPATVPPEKRRLWWQVLSGHANGLSTDRISTPIAVVPGSNGAVGRVDLRDYGWKTPVWEQLADAEPYFHVKLRIPGTPDTEEEYYYRDRSGRIRKGVRKHEGEKAKEEAATAPWLTETQETREATTALIEATQSKVPLVRADWLLFQTAAQVNRKPGYYDFLGIKDRKSFEALIGLDKSFLKRAKETELLEAVSDSGVAQNPRRIASYGTVRRMNAWWTFDNEDPTDERDPLRVLNEDFKHKAERAFGPLPNRMWTWGLFNEDGTSQDRAPDFIGPDQTGVANDGRIHPGISCIRCHYSAAHGGDSGIQDIRGWARNLFQGKLALQSPDYAVLKDLRAKYLSDLQEPIDGDRLTHARAVRIATGGLTPAEWSRGMADIWAGYVARPVTAAVAAAEVGQDEKAFVASLERYLKATGSIDPILAAFIRGIPVKRQSWEKAYPLAHAAIRGTK